MPSFDYPWPGLEEHLAQNHEGCLPVFVYGSLLNAESARRSMPGWRGEDCVPASAFGVVRIFDYPLTPDAIERYGPGPSPRHTAALGVRVTGDPNDRVSGLVYSLAPDDLAGFRQRETGYRLVEVATAPWSESPVDPDGVAFVLEYDGPSDRDLLPHPAYLDVCREGAASYGEAFRDDFDRTTRLADGRMLSEYLQSRDFGG